MVIRGGMVLGEDGRFRRCDVRTNGSVIAEIRESIEAESEEQIEADGCYVIPGMIDMHFHGCMGWDFCDGTEEALDGIARYEASVGVTSVCPATMTLPLWELERILKNAAAYHVLQKQGGCIEGRAAFVGINMEGPFISREKRGAQAEEAILPCNREIAKKFLDSSGGLVKVLGVAPEMEDSLPFIREMAKETVISLAHSDADYDTASEAFEAGASHVVHLYNAMSAFSHRAPGIVGAAADRKEVTVELICDGVHVHPAVVRATFRLFGAKRLILISDSMRAAGLTDGKYSLGGQEVCVSGNRASLVSDGSLAGSVTTLPDCVRAAVREMGIPLEEAVMAATANPAKRLAIYDRRGSISAGKDADIVIWDAGYRLKEVIMRGRKCRHGFI